MEQLRNISLILSHTKGTRFTRSSIDTTLLTSQYARTIVLVINHSVFLDLRFGVASQKTSGRHTLLVVSRKDLSHIYIHLNDSVFGIFIDSFLFWRFDLFGKAPYKKLFVCMYV